MKKKLALGAMAMVLGLGLGGSGLMPAQVFAVSVEATGSSDVSGAVASSEGSRTERSLTADDVAAAVALAEKAIAATTNIGSVAGMRVYLQGWVDQARSLDLNRLSAGQMKELNAALEEGARGLRMTAGVDRKPVEENSVAVPEVKGSEVKTSETVKVAEKKDAGVRKETLVSTVAEPRMMKELPAAKVVDDAKVDAAGAKAEVASSRDFAGLATLATAQVKQPAALVAATDGADGVEVPKTGADASEEKVAQASSAARGMGLIFGGAVVLAAAMGAVLIVKRMKRGL